MHLFPLSGQSGSHGVSSMITFEIKIWNNAKLYQSIQSYMSAVNQSRKNGRMQNSETDVDLPPRGMGSGLKRAYSKKIPFYYYWLQYHKNQISEFSWSLYRMKPIFYNFPKILRFQSKGRPLGGFERSQGHFRTTASFLYVITDKIQ